jgi:hypothetical protein
MQYSSSRAKDRDSTPMEILQRPRAQGPHVAENSEPFISPPSVDSVPFRVMVVWEWTRAYTYRRDVLQGKSTSIETREQRITDDGWMRNGVPSLPRAEYYNYNTYYVCKSPTSQ